MQIDTDADTDAVCNLLSRDLTCEALSNSEDAQQHVFYLLHSQAKHLLGGQCKERLNRILEACSRCCRPDQGPQLHHTMCIAALQDGRLDEALQYVVALQDETSNSAMNDSEEDKVEQAATRDAQRKSQHLSALLLRLKIETMVRSLST